MRLFEADESPGEAEVRKRLARAHAKMTAQGKPHSTGDQDRRDRMARVMRDPDAARILFRGSPDDWEDELPGQTVAKGSPEIEPEPLPKPDQPAPGTASGIGAARIAAKQAQPTSVSLGAKARRIDPGISTIKNRLGVSPDAFFGNAPMKKDPKTGKLHNLRGRPRKDAPQGDEAELVHEPFAAQQAQAMAKATTAQGSRPEPKTFDAGPWKDAAGHMHLPKGGEVRQTGKGQNVGTSKAGSSKLTATGDVRPGAFHGQTWSAAGFTAADEDEWADNPELAARRVGGATGKRMSFGQQAIGQRGRMTLPAQPGKGSEPVWNKFTQQWQSPEEFERSNQETRAKIAAKLAMRGASQANTGQLGRFVGGRVHAGAPKAPGSVVPKDANSQKAQARADAIASKPLGINIRRDPESEPKAQEPAKAPSERPAEPGKPVDRDEMKRRLAQRLAAMAAKKASGK